MSTVTLEERLKTVENQVREILDVWEQLGRDFELIEVNIKRGTKGMQQQTPIGTTKSEETRQWTWNPLQIEWFPKTGTKGPYEISDNVNNLDFKKMLKDLAEHQGKLNRDNCFYWTFQNGSTVGRTVLK